MRDLDQNLIPLIIAGVVLAIIVIAIVLRLVDLWARGYHWRRAAADQQA
jgi:hypothetical protein